MRNIFIIIFLSFLVAICVSCESPDSPEENKIECSSGEVSHISCCNAVISGKVTLSGNSSSDYRIGVVYSTDSIIILSDAVSVKATNVESDGSYQIVTKTLEPETTYYYRSFIEKDKVFTFGRTKSFSTLPLSSMIKTEDASEPEPRVLTLRATLNLADCIYGTLEYGFKIRQQQGGLDSTIKVSQLSGNTFSVDVGSLHLKTTYEVSAYVKLDGLVYYGATKRFTTLFLPSDAVDMGLSVLWHRYSAYGSYGDYYAWGETKTKTKYNWSTYKWCNGSETTITKYGKVDNKMVLDNADDVAAKTLGGKWRLPTEVEWNELLSNNFTWTWTTVEGVKGYMVRSNKTNCNLFFPAAGYREDGNLFEFGSSCYYWSSSIPNYLSGYGPQHSVYATIGFFSTSSRRTATGIKERCLGCSIKAVMDY